MSQPLLQSAIQTTDSVRGNRLFPVFLKLENLRLLLIGGGYTAHEKLNALLHNAPLTEITLIATYISPDIKATATSLPNIRMIERPYTNADLTGQDLVIIAVNDRHLSAGIRQESRDAGLLVNTADQPELCDFYLGSVVTKGDLKIAISTNGKSPTLAKRLKEVLQEAIPDEFDDLLQNMNRLRARLKGNFAKKVTELNKLTHTLVQSKGSKQEQHARYWRKTAYWFLFAFIFLFLGNFISAYFTISDIGHGLLFLNAQINHQFYWMLLAGFLAQLVDGALGMGYGVTCTSALLYIGVPLPAISSSIHTAEMFSSGVSGFSHYKFGNVNKKLFRLILIPGIVGAVSGAYLLSHFGEQYARYIKPLLALYTLLLGMRILLSAFKKKRRKGKLKHIGWLAGAGGFLDSFGGGGWGPLVTSTLISKGKTPRYVIGTVSLTEFFVTLASALTFFSVIGIRHWQVIAGLIIGGMIGAPIAARLAGKLPIKTMFISIGLMIILWSLNILVKILL
ncbi:MAG: TSUP family transporter [Taibaiella sp.]|jgi:hypothetical protein